MEHKLAIQTQSWADVRDEVNALSPDLCQIIDKISPDEKYPLYRVKYPFGFNILKNGEFFLPDENNQPVNLSDSSVPPELQEALSYNMSSNPVAFVLQKGLEMFTRFSDYVIPFYVFYPGTLFGLSRILDLPQETEPSHTELFIWDITSGARSCFMAPKISRTASHNKLKKHFGIHADMPKSLGDHWKSFREIYKGAVEHHNAETWQSELLLFSKEWFTQRDDPAWQALWMYFYHSNRMLNAFWRNSFSWNLAFLKINKYAGLRQSQLDLTQIVKNVFSIATGSVPGFQPAQDETFLPVGIIQNAYRYVYDLPKYSPTLLQSGYFGAQNNDPFYYSPLYPVYGDFLFSDPTAQISYINLLDEVRFIADKHFEEIQSGKLLNEPTPLHQLKDSIGLNMFHSAPAGNINILPSDTLPETDPNLKPENGREFPENSPFLKCCIQIRHK